MFTRSITLSENLRRVIISSNVIKMYPPSSMGMGRKFMKANISEMKAVSCQKAAQFHAAGKRLPIVPNDPTLFMPSDEKM